MLDSCANAIVETVPATATYFAVPVYHAGGDARTSFNEPPAIKWVAIRDLSENLKDETEERKNVAVLQHHKHAQSTPENFLLIDRKQRITFHGDLAAYRTIHEKVN
jgi:hypothetical protein